MSKTLSTPPAGTGLHVVRGPRSFPLFSTVKLVRRPADLAAALRREYGDIALTTALGRKIVVAQGPAAAEELTLNRDKAFSTEPVYAFALGRFFQRGILLMDFAEHYRDRRILQQAFTADRLASYHRQLELRVRRSIRAVPVGQAVDLRTEFKNLTLDIALEVFAGAELDRTEAAELNRACVDLIEAGGALIRFPDTEAPVESRPAVPPPRSSWGGAPNGATWCAPKRRRSRRRSPTRTWHRCRSQNLS